MRLTEGLLQLAARARKPGNQIYVEHLLGEGRGYPLWVPQANANLSKEYRRRGVSIGDVGFFTPSGEFDFLFNICLPVDDPVNPGPDSLPDGFEPLTPALNWQKQVREYTDDLHYLASSSVSAQRTDAS